MSREIKGEIVRLDVTPDARYITIKTNVFVGLPLCSDVIISEDVEPWIKREEIGGDC